MACSKLQKHRTIYDINTTFKRIVKRAYYILCDFASRPDIFSFLDKDGAQSLGARSNGALFLCAINCANVE